MSWREWPVEGAAEPLRIAVFGERALTVEAPGAERFRLRDVRARLSGSASLAGSGCFCTGSAAGAAGITGGASERQAAAEAAQRKIGTAMKEKRRMARSLNAKARQG